MKLLIITAGEFIPAYFAASLILKKTERDNSTRRSNVTFNNEKKYHQSWAEKFWSCV